MLRHVANMSVVGGGGGLGGRSGKNALLHFPNKRSLCYILILYTNSFNSAKLCTLAIMQVQM